MPKRTISFYLRQLLLLTPPNFTYRSRGIFSFKVVPNPTFSVYLRHLWLLTIKLYFSISSLSSTKQCLSFQNIWNCSGCSIYQNFLCSLEHLLIESSEQAYLFSLSEAVLVANDQTFLFSLECFLIQSCAQAYLCSLSETALVSHKHASHCSLDHSIMQSSVQDFVSLFETALVATELILLLLSTVSYFKAASKCIFPVYLRHWT